MATHINQFFISTNSVNDINENDYQNVQTLIHAVKAFARSTYQSVYIIDYFKKEVLYVSSNIEYWCGYDSDKIKDLGYQLYIDCVPEEDLKMLLEINERGFEFFEKQPLDEKLDFTLSYDFHLTNRFHKSGKPHTRMVHHTLTPILLNREGRIWLALCSVSLADTRKSGNVIMQKTGNPYYYRYMQDKHEWVKEMRITLSDTEIEIITLSSQGYTIKEIASMICKCEQYVKNHRRIIFDKLGVSNTTEALIFCINHGLLQK